ncbi:hypothetical protein F5887DRAFT_1082326 [Amanita rubescens]|nr:hypothetical protein F5887DRAFT_1082326 [Amanita rubescens]
MASGAPPWFEESIKEAIDDAIKPIMTDIRKIKNDLATVKRQSAMTYNHTFVIFNSDPFVIVPFPDGKDPTEEPNPLPPLTSLQAVKDLSENNVETYFENYGGTQRPARTIEDKRAAILPMLGVGIRLD